MPTAKQVKDARQRSQLTQGAAAELLGIDRVTLARYESEGNDRQMSEVMYRYFLHVTGLEKMP